MTGRGAGNPPVWRIAAYIRLSKDDGNDESQSVTNQRKIIMEYIRDGFDSPYSDVEEYIDDGESGTSDDERPAWQRMCRDIRLGKINCVVVKDLHRAFRNYGDQGVYLERFFPQHGTRFITLGIPRIDSYARPESVMGLDVPIHGLMNDRYALKTSEEVRRTFDMKRRAGEFIGAFAPYGYQKDPADKNRLLPDEEAAAVVRDIFHWFVREGMSRRGIAKRLNERGVPSPSAYKREKGLRYACPSGGDSRSSWEPSAIGRILRNPVYIGHMVQGRYRVVSYKVHSQVKVPRSDWFVVENTHQPTVEKETFDLAQQLINRSARTAPGKRAVHLFAGLLRCPDCGGALHRKTGSHAVYYGCRTYRDSGGTRCTKHTVREDRLKQVVLAAIRLQTRVACDVGSVLSQVSDRSGPGKFSTTLQDSVEKRRGELARLERIADSLYGDWRGGDLTREEYLRLKEGYRRQSAEVEQSIQTLLLEKREQETEAPTPLEAFRKQGNVSVLDRGLLTALIDTVYVHQHGEIEILFRFADPYGELLSQEN